MITARCFYGEPASCSHPCPFFFDIRTFLTRAKEGKWRLAYKLYRNATVFPAITCELCDAPCRAECQRGPGETPFFTGDEPVDIRAIEAAAVRFARDRKPETYRIPPRERRIAIIGAGLAGLSLALNLAQKAYPVTIFERGEKALWTWSAHPKYESFLEEIQLQFSAVKADFIYGREIDGPEDAALTDFAYVCDSTNNIGADAMTAIANGIKKSKAIETWLQTGEWPEDERYGASGESSDIRPEKHYLNHANEPNKTYVAAADPAAGYTKEEAAAEAARCMGCDCRACMDACEMLGRYNKNPRKIAIEAFSDTISAPPFTSCTLTRETYSCNLCGYCRSVCPVDVDLEKLFHLARTGRAETGRHPRIFHDFWLRDFEWRRTEGAYFAPASFTADNKPTYIFFPGCKLGTRKPSQVRSAAAFLKERYGAGVLLDCCGVPAYWAGEEALFREHLEEIRKKWERAGKPVFVFSCAYCTRLIDEFLPEIEKISIYELLADGLSPENCVCDADGDTYAVFDPCVARNFPGMETAVRKLAKVAGVRTTELTEKNRCCGFGGHMRVANPELYDMIVDHRRTEDDAPYVTYCANCAETFALSGKANAHILDFVFPDDGTEKDVALNLQQKRDNAVRAKAALSELYEGKTFIPEKKASSDLAVNLPDTLICELNKRLILTDDVKETIFEAERTGAFFVLQGGAPDGSDLYQCRLIRDVTTTWVQYAKIPDYAIIDVWNHRMRYTEEENPRAEKASGVGWKCAKCDSGLLTRNTIFSYMGMTFSHDAECCPVCGMAFVSKNLSDGKMADVEQMMEDK